MTIEWNSICGWVERVDASGEVIVEEVTMEGIVYFCSKNGLWRWDAKTGDLTRIS